MKHWKPFKPGGFYSCNDCSINIENQAVIHELNERLQSAEKTITALEELCKVNGISLDMIFEPDSE